jgi:hypothetical protein
VNKDGWKLPVPPVCESQFTEVYFVPFPLGKVSAVKIFGIAQSQGAHLVLQTSAK